MFSLLTSCEKDQDISSENVNTPFGRTKHLQAAALYRAGYVAESAPSTELIGTRSFFSKIGSAFKSLFRSIDPTWTPKATIKAWDDLLGRYIPLKGVKVLINHGGIWVSRTTDSDGYVSFPKCVGPVIYKIEWSDTYWQIFDGYIFPAYYSRSGTNRSTWNLNISSGKSLHYACIHRAARRHFYGNNCGILRPKFPMHKISYLDSDDTGDYRSTWNYLGGAAFPDIRIYGKAGNSMKLTNTVTKTAMHELSHASHCQSVGLLTYNNCSKNLKESWAVAAAYYLMVREYEELGASKNILENIREQYAYQDYTTDRIYSPLIIDLIDDENELYTEGLGCPNDPITGYSLVTIQKCLKGVTTVSGFKSNIKRNAPRGVTNRNIDIFFKTFEERWN